MKYLCSFLVLAAFLATCYAAAETWEEHVEKYKLKFDGEHAEAEAKETFEANQKLVEQNVENQKKRANKPQIGLALNGNSHIPADKFKIGALGLNKTRRLPGTRRLKFQHDGKVVQGGYQGEPFVVPANFPRTMPKIFDWRTYGITNPPTNQNPCGDCYIFSGISALEPQIAMKTGRKVKLSEQHVRDCIFNGQYSDEVRDSCKGGDQTNIYQLASEFAIMQAASYPYQKDAQQRRCPAARNGMMTGVTSIGVTSGEQNMMKALIAIGPLAVSLHADDLANNYGQWDGQRPSMYPAQACANRMENLNHAVTLIGYGEDSQNGKYWIVQNSWGPDWAGDGTMKMPRGRNACGIELEATWPCLGSCQPANNPALAKLGRK